MHGGVAVDELRSDTLSVQQMNERERVIVEPDVSPGAIQMELSLPTPEAGRNGSDIDLLGRREHRLRFFQRHSDRRPMDEHIGRAKCSPPDVGVGSQPLSELLGMPKTLICSTTVLTSSRDDRADEHERTPPGQASRVSVRDRFTGLDSDLFGFVTPAGLEKRACKLVRSRSLPERVVSLQGRGCGAIRRSPRR